MNVASIESDLSHSLSAVLQRRFRAETLDDVGIRDLMLEFVDAVGAGTQRKAGWRGTMYHASKVGQMAFASVLARELDNYNHKLGISTNSGNSSSSSSKHIDASSTAHVQITVASCCPGFVKTDMSSFCYGKGQGQKTPAQGADTPVWLALMQGAEASKSHGKFFTDREQIEWE